MPLSNAPVRRALAAALSVTACSVALAAGPATADPTTVDATTSVVVTRLSISEGRGWLTLHTRSNGAVGFEVRVPAGDGTWSGKEDVYMPEEDAHCHRQDGPDLHYLCTPSTGESQFPDGNFAVSIPVTRTGTVTGLTGRAWAFAGTAVGYEDMFPVLDGSHYRSTAEIRTAPLTGDADDAEGRANVAVTTTIVPKESITALDVTLPAGRWRIVGSNVANHGVRCGVTGSTTDSPSLHCRPDDASASGFPVGRYQLVLALDFCGEPEDQYSEVALTGSGLSPEVEDTFAWVRR